MRNRDSDKRSGQDKRNQFYSSFMKQLAQQQVFNHFYSCAYCGYELVHTVITAALSFSPSNCSQREVKLFERNCLPCSCKKKKMNRTKTHARASINESVLTFITPCQTPCDNICDDRSNHGRLDRSSVSAETDSRKRCQG